MKIKCPYCGQKNNGNSAYCAYCGHALPEPEQNEAELNYQGTFKNDKPRIKTRNLARSAPCAQKAHGRE
jgi:uncharacterized membrane protein YvbJ